MFTIKAKLYRRDFPLSSEDEDDDEDFLRSLRRYSEAAGCTYGLFLKNLLGPPPLKKEEYITTSPTIHLIKYSCF